MDDMIVSIHQPNFMPWYPFFQKMAQSDIFVILKECQFEKNNFQNRFNINGMWNTMSVNKGLEPIKHKEYVDYERDWYKIKKRLPQYNFSLFDRCISKSLMKTNVCIINKIKNVLGIKCEVVFDYETRLRGTKRLVDICKKYNAKKYLSGPSGKRYLDISEFDIEVDFFTTKKEDEVGILELLNV